MLLEMPPELQSMIASNLDALSLCYLKLVCKSIDTWVKDPPKMSATEWQQYHSAFETHARRKRCKLQALGCSNCHRLLDKGLFSDAAAHSTLTKGRLCIKCAILKGPYRKRSFKVNGQWVLGCCGCYKAKQLGDEEFSCWNRLPSIKYRNRWCIDCWALIGIGTSCIGGMWPTDSAASRPSLQ